MDTGCTQAGFVIERPGSPRIAIENGLCLAPMAGHTNMAFRKLCREHGAVGLVCTELISSGAIENRRTFDYYHWDRDEFPVAVQLYGADPLVMAEAARVVVDKGADIVDINMGCWVPKVVRKGGGVALLNEPCKAAAIVEAVVQAVEIPITVKVRSGVGAHSLTAVLFARLAQEAGASAIAVHARTAEQGFSGDADWSIIGQVIEAVRIPVIGNGDLHNGRCAARMLRETSCHGLMVGRAALGAPWFFSHLEHFLSTGVTLPLPALDARAAVALRHMELTRATVKLAEGHAVREFRGQVSRYRLDRPGESRVRDALVRAERWSEVETLLRRLARTASG